MCRNALVAPPLLAPVASCRVSATDATLSWLGCAPAVCGTTCRSGSPVVCGKICRSGSPAAPPCTSGHYRISSSATNFELSMVDCSCPSFEGRWCPWVDGSRVVRPGWSPTTIWRASLTMVEVSTFWDFGCCIGCFDMLQMSIIIVV
jgi:hypothetical protein